MTPAEIGRMDQRVNRPVLRIMRRVVAGLLIGLVTGRPPDDRITRSAWFERKHRKIDRGVRALPSVKSPAQCSACHGRAEQGVFDDDDLRMPAGLTQRQIRAWYD